MSGMLGRLETINTFFNTFRISRKVLGLILLVMLVQSVAEAFSVSLIVPFLNSLQGAGQATGGNEFLDFFQSLFASVPKEQRIVVILTTIVVLMSGVQFLMIMNQRLILYFAMFIVQNKVSLALFEKILGTRLKFFYKRRSGELINNLTQDVNRCYNCIYNLLNIITQLFFVTGYLAAGLFMMPWYTLGLLAFFGCFALFIKRLFRYLYGLGQRNVRAQEDANNIVVESVQGFRNILLSCAEHSSLKKFADVMYRYYHTLYNSSWITQSLPYFIRFLALLAIGLVLFLAREELGHGDPAFFSKMIFFIVVAGSMFRYLGTANTVYSSFAFAFEGVRNILRLNRDLDSFPQDREVGGAPLKEFRTGISARGLRFAYAAGQDILHGLDFEIKKDTKVAFVGASGSGKSTLVDVLAGFHGDYEGSLAVDGVELREADKRDWRGMLGYVSQETFIFNDTITANLTFGLGREVSEEELRRACQQAQILPTIQSFAEGFDTVLGERGIRLSGGEKQRLAIARLFLRSPTILLLDEATSALDSEAESKVKEALDALGEGRTVIAVAHRLSTISDFDVIHVMEDGRIVETGSHAELLALRGAYHKFYTIQAMGGESEE